MLLSPRLKKLHIDSLVVYHGMVFLKTRPFVKRNNAEFTDVSSFTSLLMCSTHFTLPCRILLFSLPTTNNFFKFVYSEITGQSAWQSCLGSLLWRLKVIRTWLTSILNFWYPGPSYLVQDVLYFVFSVLYIKNALKSTQFSRYSITFCDHFTVFFRTEYWY
jgi:hypothetical protein